MNASPARSLLALYLLLAGLSGCPRRSAIWIVGQEAPGRPVFGIGNTVRGDSTWLGLLIVGWCDNWDGTARNAVWFLSQDNGPVVSLSRVVYGRVPRGYFYMSHDSSRTTVSPPLGPGCYIASISGTGRVRFQISADGSVLELGDQ